MKKINIILTARIISMIFTPFYIPLIGMAALFIFSYMRVLEFGYKSIIVLTVYLFTILLPSLLIHFYQKYNGWTPIELGHKERRMVPYIISIICYFSCIFIMEYRNVPRYITIILIAALVIQMLCALINVWWKVSTHTAAIGGVTGALFAFAEIFAFNPIWWLCIVLILAGMVGTSRMILRQHSLSQVLTGFGIGFICAYIII